MAFENMFQGREEIVKTVTDFIKTTERRLKRFMSELGWNQLNQKEMVICPLNSNHFIPQSSLSRHLETCSWMKENYTKDEMENSVPSSSFAYENSTSVVPVFINEATQHKIICNASEECSSQDDEATQHKASGKCSSQDGSACKRKIPRTMDRRMTEFTQEERIAIYDYVVSCSNITNKSSVKLEDLQINFSKSHNKESIEPKSHLEVLAEERDYKRRRPSYRAKNVHITKKSYTEILREVIENQMEYLIENQSENHDDEKQNRDGEKSNLNEDYDKDIPKAKKFKSSRHRHHHYTGK